jgi:ParB family transcriptional regulator, chromosome partitioning protein
MKTIQQVPLQQIDVSDETFSVNFMPDLGRLRSSIKEIGLIEPVVLKKRNQGYQIVCGFRRVWLALESGIPTIDARVFGEKDVDDPRLFSIALHENATGRGFNTVETALALDKLVHHFQTLPSSVIDTFLPLFSLETNEKILNTYLSLARMEDDVKRYVVQEKVSRTNIRKFSSLTSEDRTAVLSLVSSLRLGENSLRETLTLLEEISPREQQTIREIADRPEIQAILSRDEFTPSQRTERVKKVLMNLRYPRMHRLEETFDEKRKAFHLPAGLSVHHQPYFEGRGLRIELRFETLEQYRSLLASLSVLSEKETFREMLIENT